MIAGAEWENLSLAGAFLVGFAAASLVIIRLFRVVKREDARPVVPPGPPRPPRRP